MHIDARELDTTDSIEGDLCIIGAGAAGISMAIDWMNKGYKVLLLEGGGFKYDEKIQDLYAGKQTGQRYYPLKSARLHYFGGTTNHWAGMCSILDPIDFKKRDWVPYSGWPITLEDLKPYYVKAHELVEIGPFNYDIDFWKSTDKELTELPLDRTVIFNKIYQFSPPTRFGEKYRDKVTGARNIHLYTHANVVDIRTNESVTSVEYVLAKNHIGRSFRFKAKYYVFACCAVQNARILLASNKQAPRGLGNDNDLVGRYWMEHPEVKSGELWINHPDRLKLYAYNDGYNAKVRSEIGITEAMQVEHKLLNGTISLSPLDIAKNMKPIIETWSKDDPRESYQNTEDANIRAVRKKWLYMFNEHKNQGFELFTRIEQSPNPDSRVTLDTETDALGMPRAKLHWALTQADKQAIRRLYLLFGQQVGISGIGRVKLMDFLQDENDPAWPSSTGGGWHHMGTTRMSDDPQTGVVDKNCQVHGIQNLYMAGSSCFATGGAVNPTLSLIALTLRLSEHLDSQMKTNYKPIP
jgi:choline dehydrogenase-like flavoprotein